MPVLGNDCIFAASFSWTRLDGEITLFCLIIHRNLAEVSGNVLKFSKLYRTLEVLHIHHGIAFGPPIVAHKIPFVLMAIRSLYGALRGEGILRVLQAVMGFSTWLYLYLAFSALGAVHETSSDALQKWSGFRGGNPWFRRFWRSCRPLRFNVAGFYYVDKGMPLTLSVHIVESTVDMVLAEECKSIGYYSFVKCLICGFKISIEMKTARKAFKGLYSDF